MGEVIRFKRPRGHVRASLRAAASAARSSAVSPALRATSVRSNGSHHSAGILFLCDHLRAAATPAPRSEASASGDGQRATTSRNVETMTGTLGHSVLNCKAILSRDFTMGARQNVPMGEAYKAAFHERVRAARKGRGWTQETMAELLGISQSHYKQWETRDLMPHEYMPRFCTLTGISLDYLLTGRERPERAVPVAPFEQVATQDRKARKSRQRAS